MKILWRGRPSHVRFDIEVTFVPNTITLPGSLRRLFGTTLVLKNSRSTSSSKRKAPRVTRGLSNKSWTMPVSIHDSFPTRAVKQYPQYSSDLGGRGIRTLVAGKPLECLTDIVQYPLATPSRRCLCKVIVWRLMFLRAIAAKYVGMECRFGKKGTTEAVPFIRLDFLRASVSRW